jgi:hypothetical protein
MGNLGWLARGTASAVLLLLLTSVKTASQVTGPELMASEPVESGCSVCVQWGDFHFWLGEEWCDPPDLNPDCDPCPRGGCLADSDVGPCPRKSCENGEEPWASIIRAIDESNFMAIAGMLSVYGRGLHYNAQRHAIQVTGCGEVIGHFTLPAEWQADLFNL